MFVDALTARPYTVAVVSEKATIEDIQRVFLCVVGSTIKRKPSALIVVHDAVAHVCAVVATINLNAA